MEESLRVQKIVSYITANHEFLRVSVDACRLGHHVGAIISPGNLLRISYGNLPEQGVDILRQGEGVDAHKLVLVCEF